MPSINLDYYDSFHDPHLELPIEINLEVKTLTTGHSEIYHTHLDDIVVVSNIMDNYCKFLEFLSLNFVTEFEINTININYLMYAYFMLNEKYLLSISKIEDSNEIIIFINKVKGIYPFAYKIKINDSPFSFYLMIKFVKEHIEVLGSTIDKYIEHTVTDLQNQIKNMMEGKTIDNIFKEPNEI